MPVRTVAVLLALAPAWLTGALAACPATPVSETADHPASTLVVDGARALQAALRDANLGAGSTLLLEPGEYQLRDMLVITRRGITIRGRSGNRDDVILRGAGMRGDVAHVVLVKASDFTLADLTAGWVRHHVVQVQGELDADRPRFINVRFVDSGEQLLKVSYRAGSPAGADRGLVERCLFEFTAGRTDQWYSGGIDVHQGVGWQVRDSVFRGIRSPEQRLAEHAIHFWSGSAHTIVERNRIIDVDRGIGFGLGDRGHLGGIIRNNFIARTRDVGIGLENARGALVAHNTVLTGGYPVAIDYRFAGTREATIQNNLTDTAIAGRDGATANVHSNLTGARAEWFEGDGRGPHLVHAVDGVIDAAATLPLVPLDIDCESRQARAPGDIGADETAFHAPQSGAPAQLPGDLRATAATLLDLAGRTLHRLERELRDRPLLLAAAIAAGLHLCLTLLALWQIRRLRRQLRAMHRALHARHLGPRHAGSDEGPAPRQPDG